MKLIEISKKNRIASFVVFNSKGEVLILKRSKTCKNNAQKWNFPGGRIEKGETREEAAIRECQEEAGLTPKNIKFLGNFGKMATFIGKTNEKPRINKESEDWAFISEKEVGDFEFVKNVKNVLKIVFEDYIAK